MARPRHPPGGLCLLLLLLCQFMEDRSAQGKSAQGEMRAGGALGYGQGARRLAGGGTGLRKGLSAGAALGRC